MYVMIVTANCPNCENSKKVLADHGLLDSVECIPISDPRGMKYAREYGLTVAGAEIISLNDSTTMSISQFIEMMEGEPHA